MGNNNSSKVNELENIVRTQMEELQLQRKHLQEERSRWESERNDERQRREREEMLRQEERCRQHENRRKEDERRQGERRRQDEMRRQDVERHVKQMRLQEEILRQRIIVKTLRPGASARSQYKSLAFATKLNIWLFGTMGVGKSSFVNSLNYAVNGKVVTGKWVQTPTTNFQGEHTTRQEKYDITENIVAVDNRGFKPWHMLSQDALTMFCKHIEGKSSFFEEVHWADPNQSNEMKVVSDKAIHCTVLVFSAKGATDIVKVIKKVADNIKMWQGCFPVAVLTNVDRASKSEIDRMTLTLQSSGISEIYQVANITSRQEHLKLEYQSALLDLLEVCMACGDRVCEYRYREILV